MEENPYEAPITFDRPRGNGLPGWAVDIICFVLVAIVAGALMLVYQAAFWLWRVAVDLPA